MDKKTDTTLKLASDKIGLEMVDNDVWVITFDRSEVSINILCSYSAATASIWREGERGANGTIQV